MNLFEQKNSIKNNIEFALKKKYSIKVYYSDDIDYKKNIVLWKYPPYQIKNCNSDKIIDELLDYFRNFEDFILVMHLTGDNITHKVPINLPSKKPDLYQNL